MSLLTPFVSIVSPENYTRAILSLSRRYSSTSVFPGDNYIAIGEWMLQDRSLLSTNSADDALLFASPDARPHDLVVVYDSNDGKWDVQSYSQEQHEDFSAATCTSNVGFGQIVFIRGFTSSLWVAALGSKYNVDPEFFRRHMDFLSPSINRHAYSFPSLTTTSNNIYRLCVSTILHRDDFSGEDLQRQRSYHYSELGTYRIQQLGSSRVCCGDSLVREYSTLCSSFSVVEQWISLYLARTESGWSGKRRSSENQPSNTDTHSNRLDGQWEALGEFPSRALDNSH